MFGRPDVSPIGYVRVAIFTILAMVAGIATVRYAALFFRRGSGDHLYNFMRWFFILICLVFLICCRLVFSAGLPRRP
jgi:hypothetical protein